MGGAEDATAVTGEQDELIKPAGGKGIADKSGDDAFIIEEKRLDASETEQEATEKRESCPRCSSRACRTGPWGTGLATPVSAALALGLLLR